MTTRNRTSLALIAVVGLILIADQWTKVLVRRHVSAPLEFGNGLLTLLHTENSGAFLSLGAQLPEWVRTIVFGVFVGVVLIAFTISVMRGSIAGRGDTIAAAAIIGGGFGNLIDRVMRSGRVTDFLYLEAGPLHTGVFNVADMAITFGVIWLLLSSLRKPRPRPEEVV